MREGPELVAGRGGGPEGGLRAVDPRCECLLPLVRGSARSLAPAPL